MKIGKCNECDKIIYMNEEDHYIDKFFTKIICKKCANKEKYEIKEENYENKKH